MPPTESSFTTDNPWDRLSDFFDTSKDEDEIPAGAADNILIAWPVFFRFIADHVPTLDGSRVLDYGCGAGSFAQRMSTLGCQVTGIDSSPAMIDKAKAGYGDAVDVPRRGRRIAGAWPGPVRADHLDHGAAVHQRRRHRGSYWPPSSPRWSPPGT